MSNWLVGSWLFCNSVLCYTSIYSNVMSIYDIFTITGAIYFSDFFSGLVHVYFDKRRIRSNGTRANTLDVIATSFQTHHESPRFFITNRPFYNPMGQLEILMYLTTPVHIITRIVTSQLTSKYDVFSRNMSIFMYTFILIATTSQILHGFSHRNKKETPSVIRFLQSCKLVIRHKEHRVHHSYYDTHFSIINGWSNPLLNILYTHVFLQILKRYPDHFNVTDVQKDVSNSHGSSNTSIREITNQ